MAEQSLEQTIRERIVEVVDGKTTKLDLNLGITAIPDDVWGLTELTELVLGAPASKNRISFLPSNIAKLSNLKRLCLDNNGFVELPPEIGALSKLEIIEFNSNEISSLPETIGQLVNLKSLHFYNNKISALPDIFDIFKNLEELNIGGNLFTDFPLEILKAKTLRELYIHNNLFDSIPEKIKELKNIELIAFGRDNTSEFPLILTELKSLKSVRCGGSAISHIPSEIKKLRNLEELLLFNNRLSALPEEIGELINLKKLVLLNEKNSEHPWKNEITRLPKGIKQLKKLETLGLDGNPLPIPSEILAKKDDPQSIINYYFSILEQNRKPINEIKLLIVGQGSVGKTSLVQQILYGTFNQVQTKTDGIAIGQWMIEQESHIKLNLWDFGGQEIMHATHQFFLTKRSLYLLVLDSRLTQEENRVEYWLKIIQSFGGESPVLIVGNKIDQHPLDIDRTGLQKKYPNIVGILETSAATGAGIEALKVAITEQVNHLPHVRDLLPETWFTVKTKLEGLGRESNFITHDKYLDLCAENEVSDETSQRTLIGFLHDLGVVLHFQDDPRLEALGILNPQWVTNGVYKILNSHALFQNKGVLTVAMLDEILNLPEYPRGKRLFIVDMMKKFELCYDLETDKSFLVPDLLPKDQAQLTFTGIPAFEYAYPVLPSSVITRFIVRMNQKIDDGFVWRTGVVLKIGDNHALVKADIEDKKITIAIDGQEYTRRDALSAIRFQLDEIHASIKGLNPEKFVPVPGAESQRYEFLLQLEHDGVKILPVPSKSGGKPMMVDVSQLLSGVESEAQRQIGAGAITNNYIQYVGGDVHTGGGDFTGRDKSISANDRSVIVGGDVKDSNIVAGDHDSVENS